MDFIDTPYIPNKGGAGRPAGLNPYKEVVAAIALKRINDKPLAKGVVLDVAFGTDDADKAVAAAKRLLAKAGHANLDSAGKALPVTTYGKASAYGVADAKGKLVVDKTKTLLTFWTAPKQNRPREVKPAVEAAE